MINLPPTPGAPASTGETAPVGASDPIANPTPDTPDLDPGEKASTEQEAETGSASTPPDPKSKTDVEPPPRGGESGTQTTEQRRRTLLEQVSTEEWMAHLLKEQEVNGPFELSKAEIDQLPPNAKMALATILAEGKAAEGELQKVQKEVEDKAAAAKADAEKAAKAKADALSWINHAGLKEKIEKSLLKPGERPDPLDEEGARRIAESKAAEFMRDFLATLAEGQQKAQEEAQKLEAQSAEERRRAEVQSYVDQHADDFNDDAIFEAIKTEMQETKGLSVQKAHEIVMNRRLIEQLRARKSPELDRARETLKRSRATSNEPPELPEEYADDPAKVLDFYNRHPGAAKRDRERLMTQGLKL